MWKRICNQMMILIAGTHLAGLYLSEEGTAGWSEGEEVWVQTPMKYVLLFECSEMLLMFLFEEKS